MARDPTRAAEPDRTEAVGSERRAPGKDELRSFQLTIKEGPGAGATWQSDGDRCSIGSHQSNQLVIDDPTVSRFHCELRVVEHGVVVTDQGSRNGTIVDNVRVKEAYVRGGSVLRLGRSVIRFDFGGAPNRLLVSEHNRFGSLVGSSLAMRSAFALLERAAAADVTVLLEGETGTGKGAAAESIHQAGSRKDGPLVVIDCGAIPANLLESELFGHEKGAFTGADSTRIGAFEEAAGGTVFLDEIGELPIDLQPKLLRVLESHTIRRVGSNQQLPVDVRVIAATNRDLRAEVNEGRFRPDLYYRLAVVKIRMPSLRERPDDIPTLVEDMLGSLNASDEQAEQLRSPRFLDALAGATWPGNIRELRNYVERWLVFRDAMVEPSPAAETPAREHVFDPNVPYADARQQAIAEFERGYLKELLAQHDGKVAAAAEAAKMDRVYLYRLIRRHGLKKH